MKNVSIKNIFNKSWVDFKSNWMILVGATIVYGIISGIIQYAKENPSPATSILALVGGFVSIYLGLTFIRTYINIADGKKVTFADFFTNSKDFMHFIKYFGTVVILSIIITAPMLLIVFFLVTSGKGFLAVDLFVILSTFVLAFVYAFIVSIFLMFTVYFSAEDRYHFLTAIKKSYIIGKNNFGKMFLLLLTSLFLNILGALALIVGLLVSIPLTWLMIVHFYRLADPEVEIVGVQ
ncbi:hypothetical protein CSB11_02865 [Candidatus Campbellbacteria bacterium]|nr:MAG: hypothetical protein CSB11_02865 [Candidatus Campbellbacteria bacterium]